MICEDKGFFEAVGDIDVTDVIIASGAGALSGGLNAITKISTTVKVIGQGMISMGEGYAKAKMGDKTSEYDVETALTDMAFGSGSASMAEAGKKFANVVGEVTDSKTLKRLQKESKRADNIAKKNSRTGRQTNAKAAKEALDNYGGGNTASAIKSTTTSAAKKTYEELTEEK